MTKEQLITEKYAIYNSDCMEVLPTIPNESIDLVVYSPPLQGFIIIQVAKEIFQTAKTKNSF